MLTKEICDDLVQAGYEKGEVYGKGGGCLRLPGWFRPSKDWDIVAFHKNRLLAMIELKSINSSFGNNANNRTEESLGSAYDAQFAIKNNLIPSQSRPPLLGYVLVIRYCEQSTRPIHFERQTLYPIDPVFEDESYSKRLTTFCGRLLIDRVYQAVWIVGVDPDHHKIYEPSPDLSYAKFLAALEAELKINKA